MTLAIGLMLLVAALVIAGTAMAGSATVFAGALVLAVVLVVMFALALEDVATASETRDDGRP